MVGLHRSGPDRDLIAAALEHGINRIDTAYSYAGGASQRLLRHRAGPMLRRLRISTKVGFFPYPGGVEHSLDPTRLRRAVLDSVTELGGTPEVIFLHNPERSMFSERPRQAGAQLAAACQVLVDATAQGWCQGWGISSWRPTHLTPIVEYIPSGARAVMIRAGLAVPPAELVAGEHLAGALGLDQGQVYGMAPFGSQPRDPAWTASVTGPFLAPGQRCTPIQAAFRVAFALPPVGRMAVGISSIAQLHQLRAATELEIQPGAVAGYQRLLSAPTRRPR